MRDDMIDLLCRLRRRTGKLLKEEARGRASVEAATDELRTVGLLDFPEEDAAAAARAERDATAAGAAATALFCVADCLSGALEPFSDAERQLLLRDESAESRNGDQEGDAG